MSDPIYPTRPFAVLFPVRPARLLPSSFRDLFPPMASYWRRDLFLSAASKSVFAPSVLSGPVAIKKPVAFCCSETSLRNLCVSLIQTILLFRITTVRNLKDRKTLHIPSSNTYIRPAQ
ncbi:hypothetical protein LXL04_035038 [Taraxacum kok-saghyz]